MYVCEFESMEYYLVDGTWCVVNPVYGIDGDLRRYAVDSDTVPAYVLQKAREMDEDEKIGRAYKRDLELGWVTDPEQTYEAAKQ